MALTVALLLSAGLGLSLGHCTEGAMNTPRVCKGQNKRDKSCYHG